MEVSDDAPQLRAFKRIAKKPISSIASMNRVYVFFNHSFFIHSSVSEERSHEGSPISKHLSTKNSSTNGFAKPIHSQLKEFHLLPISDCHIIAPKYKLTRFMKSSVKVAVIGGGIVGCSILYHLSRRGWSDVVMLERRELTAGSTWHAAASMHRLHGNPNIAKLQVYSNLLYRKLEVETGQSCGIHSPGGLYLASSKARMQELKSQHSRAKYLGFDVQLLSKDEIKQFNPLVNTDGLHGGMWDPEDGHVDPAGVPHALARGARDKGAEIYQHTEVLATRQVKDGWEIDTNNGSLFAEVVINAAGLWAREVGELAGITLPLLPMEHQYLVTESIDAIRGLGKEMPLTRDYDRGFYMRQEGEGLLVGAYEKHGVPWSESGTPKNFGTELLPPDLDRWESNLEQAMIRVPCFGEAGIRQVINGPMVFSPDGLPQLGPVQGLRNYFVAVGIMAGFSQGGGIGKTIADWIIDGNPDRELFPLDVTRFGDFATHEYTKAKVLDNYARRFAIHYPNEERLAGRPSRVLPIHELLLAKGAVMGSVHGLERPLWYRPAGSDIEDIPSFERNAVFDVIGEECRALRSGLGLLELSSFGQLIIDGPDATDFIERVFAGKLPKNVGVMSICPMLNETGGIIGDYTVTLLKDGAYYLTGASNAEAYHFRCFEKHRADLNVKWHSLSKKHGVFGVAGPHSRTLMQRLTGADMSNKAQPFFRMRELMIDDIPVRAFRVSFTGDLGYELHFAEQYQLALFARILAEGEDLHLRLVGARALDSLRLEKSYPRWGLELTADTLPGPAGMNRFLDKNREYIGHAALQSQQKDKQSWRLVCLTIETERADAIGNEPVIIDGRVIGVVTSGGYGHSVGKSIALAYLKPEYCCDGQILSVDIIGNNCPARVHLKPLFDPMGYRLRGISSPDEGLSNSSE